MTAKDYRDIAWQKVKSTMVLSVLAGLVAWFLGGMVTFLNFNFTITVNWNGDSIQLTNTFLQSWVIHTLGIGGILGIVRFILGGPIRQGYCLFLLKQHDGEPLDIKDLFSQLSNFGAGFCLKLLEGLYIALWMVLLLIPGFVAIYKYAMAPFIMLENPDMTASEAITASKDLMNGHKWELFCLDFSFFGWIILSTLTLGIGYLFVAPYMDAAHAAFYRELTRTDAPGSGIPTNLPPAEPQA